MKADIEVKLQENLRDKLLGLPEFVVDYIFDLEFRKKQIRTRIEYAKDLRLFLEFLHKERIVSCEEIKDITPSDLDKLKARDIGNFLSYLTSYKKEFITKTGKHKIQVFTNSDVGKSRKIATLHEFFSYLLEEELIQKDVTKKVDVKVDKQAVIKNRLTPEDMQKFYSTILDDLNIQNKRMEIFHQKVKFRDYIIVLLLSYTGIRISELVQLDIDDIGINEKVMIVVRKGGKQEKLTLPERVMEDIAGYIQQRKALEYDTKAMFISLHKKRIDPKTIRAMLDKYRIRAGIEMKVTPHVFRRTFGTEHYNRYRDMYLTAQIMGHNSAETTRKFYADPAEERRSKSMQEFDYKQDGNEESSVSVSVEKLQKIAKLTGVSIEDLLKAT
ncbi:tyrosine-type recombinase/integrase (plasmid) [Aneurinibacillus sp. Ricciae_BoGa-3]|uniref:tyrosine-type recombinase/integrase n=1 Tax=Aneurinibacillus sp. Ricciae_BoGa-3 TaxID=3022697 RepID=UPI002341A0EF|nr:tyrosine-type recombinase/integrase [Aneurinibacillus sp. Ricciae_BoGa-3]WCK57456.1 tyrosine-type recombinase/integrase [Aneurinibacillus sp. Ricciae_BoGa-3]